MKNKEHFFRFFKSNVQYGIGLLVFLVLFLNLEKNKKTSKK